MKYQCSICKYIYDEKTEEKNFSSLSDTYVCPMCYSPKSLFRIVDSSKIEKEVRVFQYAVKIDKENPGVQKDDDKCIDCGICKQTCMKRCGEKISSDPSLCLSCGQCILTCPTGALKPRSAIQKVQDALSSGKTLICYTSPATRVSIGEAFGYPPGTFLKGKLVALLKRLGFHYVFDTTFGADLTVMEEATEFVERIQNNGPFPMFSSCCPAWVKYCEQMAPEFQKNLSSCKSPIAMQGAVIERTFLKDLNKEKSEVLTVAITPCTAKKMEVLKESIFGTDEVLTIQELVSWAKEEKILFQDLEEEEFDLFFQEGSGAGTIFGTTGGVCEAALRTAYHILTGEDMEIKSLEFHEDMELENVKEATIVIDSIPIHVAVIHKISAVKPLFEAIKSGRRNYHFIEVMNCENGCVGGGGQPKLDVEEERALKKERGNALLAQDQKSTLRYSYQNKDVLRLYEQYLDYPGSPKAKELLHIEQEQATLNQ